MNRGSLSMWIICKATLGRGKNKLLIRGVEGVEWVFCPLIKSFKRDRVSIDRCQKCKHFVRFQQIHVPETSRTSGVLFFGTTNLKSTYRFAGSSRGSRISRSHATPLSPIPGLTKEREPLLDLFEEGDHLIVLADLPNVDENDINIKAEENTLTISADTAARKYLQKVELPTPIKKDSIKYTHRNGILQVILEKL